MISPHPEGAQHIEEEKEEECKSVNVLIPVFCAIAIQAKDPIAAMSVWLTEE